ncbi:MAG: endo-1,4-beta-xylanase [Symplocastrum torsivum CPER-KK1]|jgi:endo-1,4-beta-xylanase|uniref:Endo-1,4-beta-xylanase n=1 Tax=Symplocastrum torsivum CPER-KK1 TaxID=450513 RepID=A0A951UBI0_9CYAN|nr:endo-1,4-beta-xylanase [Symplocastrum torsivum CPER-KK1]
MLKHFRNKSRLGALVLLALAAMLMVSLSGSTQLAEQAAVYRNMMRVCLEAENCTGFVVWGVSDRHSWIPSHYNQPDLPLIFDKSFRPKPAYEALTEELQRM